MTSLTKQLTVIRKQNETLITNRRARSKIHSKSLLFKEESALAQNFEYIYQIACDGLEELSKLDSRFSEFKKTLFFRDTIKFDRNVQMVNTLEDLNKEIDKFLILLGPYYQTESGIKALEWLVRRFQINYYNTDSLLFNLLFYFKHTVFFKILNIIPNSCFSDIFKWLINYKKNTKLLTFSTIIKAFHNDIFVYKIYIEILNKQIKSLSFSQEHLFFHLFLSVQLLSLFSKDEEFVYKNILPLMIENICLTLSIKVTTKDCPIFYDLKSTILTIISVMGSVVSLSPSHILTLTNYMINDEYFFKSKLLKNFFITLGQIWNFFNEDFTTVDNDTFQNLNHSFLIENEKILTNIINNGFHFNKFLSYYFFSTFPNSNSFNIFGLIRLNQSNLFYNSLVKLFFKTSNLADLEIKNIIVKILELLLENDFHFFKKVLHDNKISLYDLELRLGTTLNYNNLNENLINESFDTDINQEKEEIILKKHDNLLKIKIEKKHNNFFDINSNEDFIIISKLFIQNYCNLNIKKNYNLIKKFSNNFFSSENTSFSFFITFALSSFVPSVIRHMILKYIKIELKSLIKINKFKRFHVYLLIPIILLGLIDLTSLRTGFIEILKEIKSSFINFNHLEDCEKDKKDIFFLENEIYSGSETNKNLFNFRIELMNFCDSFFEDNHYNSLLIKDSFLTDFLFNNFFKNESSKTKKKDTNTIKKFIFDQWSIHSWPIAIKSKIWQILGAQNLQNPLEIDYLKPHLNFFYSNMSFLIKETNILKIDMQQIEQNIVNLLPYKITNDDDFFFVNEWIIKSLKLDNSNFVNLLVKRIIQIFKHLNHTSKENFFFELINYAIDNREIDFDPFFALQSLDLTFDFFILIFEKFQIDDALNVKEVTKKIKVSNSDNHNLINTKSHDFFYIELKKITIILDILETNLRKKTFNQISIDLLKVLFNLLNYLIHLSRFENLSVFYTQETLASCLYLTIMDLKKDNKSHKLSSNFFKFDLIIDCIRNSQSPQVQNKFLLVVAELASLEPKLVLYSIMPFFTFMGTNTIKQDDDFSSMIIQEAISKVIPALIKYGSSINYEIEMIFNNFVCAFFHIPKHRHLNLFYSLINIIEAKNSLHIFLFLIGQKYAINLINDKDNESNFILEFSITLLKKFSVQDQLNSFINFLNLWKKIPVEKLSIKSVEYKDLISSLLFRFSNLLTDENDLLKMKIKILEFFSSIIHANNQNESLFLKFEISMFLYDKNLADNDKKFILDGFENIISLIHGDISKVDKSTKFEPLVKLLNQLSNNFLILIPFNYFVSSFSNSLKIEHLLSPVNITIATNYCSLIINKINTEFDKNLINENDQNIFFAQIIPILISGFHEHKNKEIICSYLNTFSLIVKVFSIYNNQTKDYINEILLNSLECILSENCLLNSDYEIILFSINAIINIIEVLGIKIIKHFSRIFSTIVKIWNDFTNIKNENILLLLQPVIITFMLKLVKKLSDFMINDITTILKTIFLSNFVGIDIKSTALVQITESMQPIHIFKSLYTIWCSESFHKQSNTEVIGLFISILKINFEQLSQSEATLNNGIFLQIILKGIEFRSILKGDERFKDFDFNLYESSFYDCSITYIMKLNDAIFKPLIADLIRKLINKEYTNEIIEINHLKYISFFKFFNRLQESFKSILTSYYSYLLDPVSSFLIKFSTNEMLNASLKKLVLNSLFLSFKYDKDGFWTQQNRFEIISNPLLSQFSSIECYLNKILIKTVSLFASIIESEDQMNFVFDSLIKFFSSSKSTIRIYAIKTLKLIFKDTGVKYISMLPKLVPHVSELLHEGDENVEIELKSGLIKTIESITNESFEKFL